MDTENIVELKGTITKLQGQGCITEVDFAMRDELGRLLTIHYKFRSHQAAVPIYESLKNGMRVRVAVEGPVVNTKASYNGVGFITIED